MQKRIYLDTSVISLLHDVRSPERRQFTAAFWAKLNNYNAISSDIAYHELARTPDKLLREKLIASFGTITRVEFTPAMEDLANRYVAARIFTNRMIDDARHVAACVLTHCDVLVSWNFQHLANEASNAQVSIFNQSFGLPRVAIIAPSEFR